MHKLTYDDIMEMCHDIHAKLPKRQWAGILAVTRGGLVPAGILSQCTDIRRIEVVNIKSYENQRQSTIEIANSPQIPDDGKDWLIIEDLADTGNTLRCLRKSYSQAFYTTLLVKPKGKDVVDLYSREYPQDLWLHFPWEVLEG
jgi:xanthine phosphoribosyltransferase